MSLSLEYDGLAQEVERRTGGAFEPSDRFAEGMKLLIADVDQPGVLTLAGRRLLQAELLRVFSQRLHFDAMPAPIAWKDEPEVVVITGRPRTKSTLLHNLIADLGTHTWLPLWQALEPLPLTKEASTVDERIDRARQQLRFMSALSPDLLDIHPMREDRPEECITLMQLTGASDRWAISLMLPTYSEWERSLDFTAVYREYRQMLMALYPSAKRIVLKAPSHAPHLAALEAAFPRARVFWLHRPIDAVEESFERLVVASRRVFLTDPTGDGWTHHWRDCEPSSTAEVVEWDRAELIAERIRIDNGLPAPDRGVEPDWPRPRTVGRT